MSNGEQPDPRVVAADRELALLARKHAVNEPRPVVYPAFDPPTSVYKRFSPTKNRWPELAEYDRRILELEQRQASLVDELSAFEDRHAASLIADKQILAEWMANGSGPRPEAVAPSVAERIEPLKQDRDALELGILRVLDAKSDFVQKHRRRLQRDATKATEQAVDAYKRKLDELEELRNAALEARQAALWASFYPGELTARDIGGRLMLGGRKLKSISWYVSQTSAESVLDLLRADAEWIRNAVTEEQRAELEGRDPRLDPDTTWADSPEGGKVRERQSREARERVEAAQCSGSRWEE